MACGRTMRPGSGLTESRELIAEVRRVDSMAEYLSEEGCYITELLNHETDQAVSIARARVRPGESTVAHSLSGVIERYVIIQGQGVVTVGDIQPQSVKTGDVVANRFCDSSVR